MKQSSSLARLADDLRTVPSAELLSRTERLAGHEHQRGAHLIAHLAEVDSRRLHLELGYRSMFDYATRRLGLTEGSAALRIQVSRVCGRYPRILEALATQEISLTVAGKLAPHLTPENSERLISDCRKMTKREVEEYLTALAPKPAVTSGARRQPETSLTCSSPGNGSAEPCQPGLYNLRFAADRAFMDKLERAAELTGLGDAGRQMARILECALESYLEKHDPRHRQERRDKRAARTAAAEAQVVAVTAEAVARKNRRTCGSRTIPASIRDRLLLRAGHRCEYVGRDGLRCSERAHLEIDHRVPWALGGTNREENLRVLCGAHNRLAADRCYGADFMDRKIEAARTRSGRAVTEPATSEPAKPATAKR